MTKTIALISAASLFALSAAFAQNSPPPGNVNPGSMKSGAEQSGAPNQPRSQDGQMRPDGQMGTTGAGQGASPAVRPQQESSPDSTAGGAAGTSKDRRPQ